MKCVMILPHELAKPVELPNERLYRKIIKGRIVDQVLVVRQGLGQGERVGEQIRLGRQIGAVLAEQTAQVLRSHEKDRVGAVAKGAIDLLRAMAARIDAPPTQHLCSA